MKLWTGEKEREGGKERKQRENAGKTAAGVVCESGALSKIKISFGQTVAGAIEILSGGAIVSWREIPEARYRNGVLGVREAVSLNREKLTSPKFRRGRRRRRLFLLLLFLFLRHCPRLRALFPFFPRIYCALSRPFTSPPATL